MPGLYYEQFEVGQRFEHPVRRTVTETDNVLFSTMTMNPAALHLDAEYCKGTPFGERIVNSLFTLGLLIGLTVADTTFGTTLGNLGMDDVKFPKPVLHGDTLRAVTAVLAKRESQSRSDSGIVTFEHRALNQRNEEVAVCRRVALMMKQPGMSEAQPRSWLFVPGDSERKQAKALGGEADAVILDLEDSVSAQQLPAARRRVADVLAKGRARATQQVWVRINCPSGPMLDDDLAAVTPFDPDGIVLPKVSSVEDIARVCERLAPQSRTRVLVIATETPRALLTLPQWNLAVVGPRLAGLTWGMEDLGAALGTSTKFNEDGSLAFTFEMARSTCLLAAAAAGVQAVDSIHADFRDAAGLARDAARARRDGFTGKLAIHPDQIVPINAAFNPTPAEIAWAHKVVAVFAASPEVGVASLDGAMIDRPHLVQAQRLLRLAALTGSSQ